MKCLWRWMVCIWSGCKVKWCGFTDLCIYFRIRIFGVNIMLILYSFQWWEWKKKIPIWKKCERYGKSIGLEREEEQQKKKKTRSKERERERIPGKYRNHSSLSSPHSKTQTNENSIKNTIKSKPKYPPPMMF